VFLFRNERSTPANAERTYQTAAGQNATVSLGGGSMATLAPSTTIQVTASTATVQGEAYFRMVPHPDRPFVVNTANSAVEVLGTKFVVRQYPKEHSSRVMVEEGKVGVRYSNKYPQRTEQAVLTARMLAEVTDSGVIVTVNVPVDEYTGWATGRLAFDGAPLGDVVKALEQAYGVEIRLADTALARQPIVMAASVRDEPISDVLDFVTMAVNARYKRVGQAYVIVAGPARVQQRRPASSSLIPEQRYGR
jgi:ferric-dicitrate binding protein FerR (iron transport regulator)